MNSPTEQQLGAALHDLVADQPFTPDPAAIEHRARQDRKRRRITGGIAGAVAVAAVAAVGTAWRAPRSGPAQAGAAGSTARTSRRPPGRRPPRPRPRPRRQRSADTGAGRQFAGRSPHPTGDATLFERETAYPGKASINVWDLYADNGKYYFSRTKSGLPAQVKATTPRAAACLPMRSRPRPTPRTATWTRPR